MVRCLMWWPGGITWMLLSETSTYMPVDLVLFNQTCLMVHWKSKRKATWPISLHQTCQLTLWNFIRQDCYFVNTIWMPAGPVPIRVECCYVASSACRPSITSTSTAAVQACLLVECCCKMDAGWTVATSLACLPIFCRSILHVCLRCASLYAITAGMVSHYQSCLLVWYLTLGDAFRCGAS